MYAKLRGILLLLVCCLLFTFLPGCQSSGSTEVPLWVRGTACEYSDIKWALENGYFYEEPVVVEQDGVKLTIWATLADLALTQVVYAVEDEKERDLFAYITAVDEDPIEGRCRYQGITRDGTTGVLFMDPLPEGEHQITITVRDKQADVLKTTVTADRNQMSHINSKYELNQNIDVKNGFITINYVVYTPTQIYVNLTNKGALLVNDLQFPDLGAYLTADNNSNIPAPIMGGSILDDNIPYNLEIARPLNADDLKLAIPAVYYADDIELVLTPEDVGVEKTFAETEFTLLDWRKEDDFLELDILFSSIGGLYRIIDWEAPNVSSSEQTNRSFDNRTYPDDDHVVTFSFPRKWVDLAAVTATKAEMIAKGPWTLALPNPESTAPAQSEGGENNYSSMPEAFEAIKMLTGKELYFENGIYVYNTEEAYEYNLPSFILFVSEGEVKDNLVDLTAYLAEAETITVQESISTPRTEDEHETVKQANTLENCEDLTHLVVNMATENGRDLAKEASSFAKPLRGFHTGDWFYVTFDTELPQAAYNVTTEELVVADDINGLSVIDGIPQNR